VTLGDIRRANNSKDLVGAGFDRRVHGGLLQGATVISTGLPQPGSAQSHTPQSHPGISENLRLISQAGKI
jgi:hypothetical protein